MGKKYKTITLNEPENFLDYWDGFPEVYFDNKKDWITASKPEPTRATKDGLSVDESWTLGDGPFLFDKVENKSDQFKSCLLYTSPSPRDKRQSRMPSSA